MQPRVFYAQIIVLIAVAILHITALEYKLYWYFVWLDVLAHFLGGTWAILTLMWLSTWHYGSEWRFPPLLALAAALLVGVGWELFEFTIGIPRDDNFVFDTAVDLLMDTLGGMTGWALGRYIERNQTT